MESALSSAPLKILGLCVGPLQENAWLAGPEGGGEAMAVDPGAEPERIEAAARGAGWTLRWILLTHSHIDHIGAAGALRRATGARIAAPEREIERLNDTFYNGAEWLGFPFEPVTVDLALREGEEIEAAGRRWRMLHTPGHTSGHACFYGAEEGALFAGDLLFAGSVGRTDLPGGSWQALARSLREVIFPLPPATRVFPGHGGATTLERERRENPFVRQALESANAPASWSDFADDE